MEEKIKFGNLNGWLKTAVIVAYVELAFYISILINAFFEEL